MREIKIINYLKKEVFQLSRSLGGKNNILTLVKIKKILKNLKLKKIKSGKKIFDWVVPKTWELSDAYIKDEKNRKIIDAKNNFLHILNYSISINKKITKKELFKNLYFLKNKPNAIPYVTSYYKKKWGFCIKYSDKKKFTSSKYKVYIKSSFSNKGLDYGEFFLKGKSRKEILFSTYICHPSLGNDNFSGLIMNTLIANYVSKINRKYSYRFIFIPETIGSLYYIKKNLFKLQKKLIAGYVLTCLGKGKEFNILSKYKDNLSYNFLINFFSKNKVKYKYREWSLRGSDERQFSSPNVNLPFTLITRDKFLDYKEYHNSLDNIDLIKNSHLLKNFIYFKKFINFIESEDIYLSKFKGEPFLSKRNLYSNIASSYKKNKDQDLIINVLDYCDGKNSVNDIINKLNYNSKKIVSIIKILVKHKLVSKI